MLYESSSVCVYSDRNVGFLSLRVREYVLIYLPTFCAVYTVQNMANAIPLPILCVTGCAVLCGPLQVRLGRVRVLPSVDTLTTSGCRLFCSCSRYCLHHHMQSGATGREVWCVDH